MYLLLSYHNFLTILGFICIIFYLVVQEEVRIQTDIANEVNQLWLSPNTADLSLVLLHHVQWTTCSTYSGIPGVPHCFMPLCWDLHCSMTEWNPQCPMPLFCDRCCANLCFMQKYGSSVEARCIRNSQGPVPSHASFLGPVPWSGTGPSTGPRMKAWGTRDSLDPMLPHWDLCRLSLLMETWRSWDPYPWISWDWSL